MIVTASDGQHFCRFRHHLHLSLGARSITNPRDHKVLLVLALFRALTKILLGLARCKTRIFARTASFACWAMTVLVELRVERFNPEQARCLARLLRFGLLTIALGYNRLESLLNDLIVLLLLEVLLEVLIERGRGL